MLRLWPRLRFRAQQGYSAGLQENWVDGSWDGSSHCAVCLASEDFGGELFRWATSREPFVFLWQLCLLLFYSLLHLRPLVCVGVGHTGWKGTVWLQHLERCSGRGRPGGALWESVSWMEESSSAPLAALLTYPLQTYTMWL